VVDDVGFNDFASAPATATLCAFPSSILVRGHGNRGHHDRGDEGDHGRCSLLELIELLALCSLYGLEVVLLLVHDLELSLALQTLRGLELLLCYGTSLLVLVFLVELHGELHGGGGEELLLLERLHVVELLLLETGEIVELLLLQEAEAVN
jgi:hypothetical protein